MYKPSVAMFSILMKSRIFRIKKTPSSMLVLRRQRFYSIIVDDSKVFNFYGKNIDGRDINHVECNIQRVTRSISPKKFRK